MMSIYGFCLRKDSEDCFEDCEKCGLWRKVSKEVFDKGIKEYLKISGEKVI